jgi:hypothetical protein
MTNYTDMCEALASAVDFNADSPVASPDGSPFDAQSLADLVQASVTALPMAYRTGYAGPLLNALPEVARELKQEYDQAVAQGAKPADALAEVQSTMDTLVGAVRDWTVPEYAAPLHRFEAVISNFYRSFLSETHRVKVNLPLIETVPPLVTFARSPDQGPFTLTADTMADIIRADVAVVSLPGSYRAHPLIWPALAHECGGHDVLHADPGLLKELGEGVAKLPQLPAGLGPLWSSWIDEAASDVYGLLNIGPAFAVSLSAFFSALRAAGSKGKPKLGPISNVLPVQGRTPVDPHPVDLLRVHLAIGATSQLTSLGATAKTAWLTDLAALAVEAAGGKTTIDVVDVDKRQIVQSLPIGPMAEAAKAVGAFIVTAHLEALAGHSIQDIETWDDFDEHAAQEVRAACGANRSLIGLGDDAQLLAGTTLALRDKAADYQAITDLLNAALDDSFARDPVFAPPAPRFMRIATEGDRVGKGYAKSPAFPLFPIPVPEAA